MAALKSVLYVPLSRGRTIFRTLCWIGAGLMMIIALGCVAIFFSHGSPDSLAAAAMFLCFGGIAFITAFFYDDILAGLRPGGGTKRA